MIFLRVLLASRSGHTCPAHDIAHVVLAFADLSFVRRAFLAFSFRLSFAQRINIHWIIFPCCFLVLTRLDVLL